MKRILVWDLPVRVFHWLLAASFLGAFAIANLVDDESTLFVVHMWLGGIVAFMVLLRLVWGLVGSRHARFGGFALSPKALVEYVKGTISGKGERHAGHNPASSFAAIAMFVLALGLALTGALMSSGGEAFEEIHEVLAWTMMAIVALHVAGIVLHTMRHRENIALSMISGRKLGEPAAAIESPRALVAVAFLGLTGLWAGALYDGYDAAGRQVTLPLVGQTLKLGEAEEHEGASEGEKHERRGHHDDDDDDD